MQEVISTCGKLKQDTIHERSDDFEVEVVSRNYYYPKMFYPTIKLFAAPNDTPELISNELDSAFGLFWSNPSACGNSIRKVVERIIDEIDPDNVGKKLHTRIERLPDGKYLGLKRFLLASKWIGNDGSHQSDLEHYDVILAFEFIDLCLVELFDKKRKNLDDIVRSIIEHSKPLSKI